MFALKGSKYEVSDPENGIMIGLCLRQRWYTLSPRRTDRMTLLRSRATITHEFLLAPTVTLMIGGRWYRVWCAVCTPGDFIQTSSTRSRSNNVLFTI